MSYFCYSIVFPELHPHQSPQFVLHSSVIFNVFATTDFSQTHLFYIWFEAITNNAAVNVFVCSFVSSRVRISVGRWKCSARSWDVCMFCFSRYCWFSKVAVSASVPASGTWVSQCSAGSSALGTQSSFQLFCWVVVRSRCGFSCHFPLLNWKVWKLSRCLAEFRYLLLQSAYWRLLLIFKWDYLYFFFFLFNT